jgi:hypothetical protein
MHNTLCASDMDITEVQAEEIGMDKNLVQIQYVAIDYIYSQQMIQNIHEEKKQSFYFYQLLVELTPYASSSPFFSLPVQELDFLPICQ